MSLSPLTALCHAMTLPAAGDGAAAAPEWVHLLPAGAIRTQDGRGPYTVKSMQAVAALLKPGEKLPIDECHATDRAAPLGQPAPARGWIVALEARADGLWGKVEWTATGLKLLADKAYRGISPAILHDKANAVLAVLRASLVNTPNLVGLTALHDEGSAMDWKAKLIERLGLDGDADDAAIDAALAAKTAAPALHSQQADIAQHPSVVALQGELSEVTGKFNALNDQVARDKATAFVDAAIAEGRVGLKPLREDYIALHMTNADQAKKLIGGMPVLKGSSHAADVPVVTDESGLDAGDRQVIALMGLSEDEYKARKSAVKETL